VKTYDLYFRNQNQKICLLIDNNFSGHKISYQPTNILIEFFAPNLTPFVQPLDAGIICCFKAHYWKAFCLCAVELDDVGEADIYKVNLLEVLTMVKAAWDSVTADTIAACWRHATVERYVLECVIHAICTYHAKSVHGFACGHYSLPETETYLKAHLKERYRFEDWKAATDAALAADGDDDKASAAVQALVDTVIQSCDAAVAPVLTHTQVTSDQLSNLEVDLMESVAHLKWRNCIHGPAPTLEDLLNPVEELEVGKLQYGYPGGDDEIIEEVMAGTNKTVESVEIDEQDQEEEEEEEEEEKFTMQEAMQLCEQDPCILL